MTLQVCQPDAASPPSVTIETEGRAGDRNCHSTIASERRDQAKVIDPERVCDPE